MLHCLEQLELGLAAFVLFPTWLGNNTLMSYKYYGGDYLFTLTNH